MVGIWKFGKANQVTVMFILMVCLDYEHTDEEEMSEKA